MKKLSFILFTMLVVLGACNKELQQDPISSATTATFYATQNDFIQGINAVYNSLRDYPGRQLNLSETRSDNLYAVSDGGVRDWEGINSFHKTISSNPFVSEAYSANFNGIYRANVLIDQINKNGAVIGDDALKTRLEAEAKFLRAVYYFDLIRWFGSVPVSDRPLTATEALALPRSPISDVYSLIIADLKFAGDKLPSPEAYAVADKGRATKFAAKGLLALVHMTRSGPTYGINGPGLGLNEWNDAATLLNEVISSNKYSFLPGYSNIFSYTNENNAEVIFDVQYISGTNPLQGTSIPGFLVPNLYFQAIGSAAQGDSYIRPISNDLLNSYEAGDIRKAFTIQPGFVTNGVPETRSFYKKYLDVTKIPATRGDFSINFIVMRYTDILMLKAECILKGAAGTPVDVDKIVNQVRQRAGLAEVTNVTLNRLMEERRKEFAGEGLRWHDLVRSGLVESKMSAWIPAEDVLKMMQPFNKNYIIYPIPQSELDVKQGLYTQNEGY